VKDQSPDSITIEILGSIKASGTGPVGIAAAILVVVFIVMFVTEVRLFA
jgi:hypothetical protein